MEYIKKEKAEDGEDRGTEDRERDDSRDDYDYEEE